MTVDQNELCHVGAVFIFVCVHSSPSALSRLRDPDWEKGKEDNFQSSTYSVKGDVVSAGVRVI